MQDAVRFATRHDVARLLADLAAAVEVARWIEKPEKDRYFEWSAIPLYTQYGAVSSAAVDLHVPVTMAGDFAPTPAGRACGHVREIVDAFAAARLRVRFMRLGPGGRIGRHRDRQYGWGLPILRLHVPVVTNPDVELLLADRCVVMAPGELWYLDTTKDHEVVNRGATERVHLVIDLVNGPALREQLTGWL